MGLLGFFGFGRDRTGQKPGADEERWSPGDLAECIYGGPWHHAFDGAIAPGPALGERYVVADVQPAAAPELCGPLVLAFARFRPRRYAAAGFRKVVPRADEAVAGTAATLGDLLAHPEPVEAPAPVEKEPADA